MEMERQPPRGDFGGDAEPRADVAGPGVKSMPSISGRSGVEGDITSFNSAGRQGGSGRGGRSGGKIEAAARESESASSRVQASEKGSREGDDWTVAGLLCAICSSPLDRERQGGEAFVSSAIVGSGEKDVPRERIPVPLAIGCCTSCNNQVLAPLRSHAALVGNVGVGGTDHAVLSMLPEIVAERLLRA